MSAVALATPAEPEAQGRLQGVLAYVGDAESEATIRRVAANLALPGFELRRGDVRMAERDLKSQRSPSMLFVDVAGHDTVLEAMQRLSEVCEPQVQVVVVGTRNDVGLYRELVALGAADYLFKPLTAELVENVLWRLLSGSSRDGDARQGKLVALGGVRGGAGASSLAACVASYLAEKASRRVALVDLDTRTGAQALLMNAKPNAGLAEALENPSRIDDLFLERATIPVAQRLDLLASEMPLGRIASPSREACETLLARLRRSYHYVVIDVPRDASDSFAPVFALAHTRLLVHDGSLLAARDAARRMDAGTSGGHRTLLVHNKAGRPGDLEPKDLEAALRRAPDLVVPFVPKAFGAAVNLGQPAWRVDAKVEAAVARLARELSGQATRAAPPAAWKRLLGLGS